jgi:hypothetical protein
LEDLLDTTIRVFVPPNKSIGRQGLRAIARQVFIWAATHYWKLKTTSVRVGESSVGDLETTAERPTTSSAAS